MSEKISAETIMNDLWALRLLQAATKGQPKSEEVKNLEDLLREEIRAWGGLEAIENWLTAHRPRFPRPSGITHFDWSWFRENM